MFYRYKGIVIGGCRKGVKFVCLQVHQIDSEGGLSQCKTCSESSERLAAVRWELGRWHIAIACHSCQPGNAIFEYL